MRRVLHEGQPPRPWQEKAIRKSWPPWSHRALAKPGRHKVLFGTNYPMIVPAKALEGLDSLQLDDEARALFLGDNARRVFKLG